MSQSVVINRRDLDFLLIAPHLRASDDFEPNFDASGQVKVLPELAACRYFAEFELPKVAAWLHPIELGTNVTAAMPLDEFLGEVA